MKITFDNRSSSPDTLESVGKRILQTILENGIYEEIELDVTDDDSGSVTRYTISVDSTYNVTE